MRFTRSISSAWRLKEVQTSENFGRLSRRVSTESTIPVSLGEDGPVRICNDGEKCFKEEKVYVCVCVNHRECASTFQMISSN